MITSISSLPFWFTFLTASLAAEKNSLEKLGEFVKCNGAKYATIFYGNEKNNLATELQGVLSKKMDIFTQLWPLEYGKGMRGPFNVVIMSNINDFDQTVEKIHNYTIKSVLLYFPRDLKNQDWENLKGKLQNANINSLFYVADGSESLNWNLVFTIKGQQQIVMNQIKFEGNFDIFK